MQMTETKLGFSGLKNFMANPVKFMQSCAERGHDFTRLRFGLKNFVFVFNPEAAQEILVKRADVYVQNRTIFDRIKPVTGKKGLVQLSGSESQKARAKLRPMFTKDPLEECRAYIETYTQELIKNIGAGATLNVTETMTDLILRTALKIFLGIDSTEMVSAIGPKFLRLNHLCGLRMRALMPLPLFVPVPNNREILSLQKEIRSLLTKHLAGQKKHGTSTVPFVFRDDKALIDHCMTFIFAGHETTAASLAFTLLLLAKHKAYQNTIAGGDMDMTLAIYKESLRLYPPAYMLARQTTSQDDLLGFKIKKSDQVLVGIASMQRNSQYFERPNDFYPERFLKKLSHPFAFIPFGAGGKSCVGERLAYLEATTILKLLCTKYSISSFSEEILAEPLITLHPSLNQQIRFEERTM